MAPTKSAVMIAPKALVKPQPGQRYPVAMLTKQGIR
jgi:hypothetical protein